MEFNRNAQERDKILFGFYDENAYWGGCRNFERVTPEEIKTCIERGFADPQEDQNGSPTIREFLDFAENVSDESVVTFAGYVITKERPDYRMNIDAVDLSTTNMDDVVKFANEFHYADEFEIKKIGDQMEAGAWWD